MKMPNLDKLLVPPEKVTDYLLSLTHRDGRHKARFFLQYGYTLETWQELRDTLLNHARTNEAAKEEASPFGKRYVIEGKIQTPDGRYPRLRSVWFIAIGGETPRFVTAYPLKGEEGA